jgi:subtilisin
LRGFCFPSAFCPGGLIVRTRLVLALGLVLATTPPAAPGSAAGAGKYIVVVENGVDPAAVAEEHARRHGAQVRYLYRRALEGYAATIPDGKLGEVRSDPRVDYLSPDRPVSIAAQGLPTGINRVDGERSSTLAGNGAGAVNADVAVLDTGIDVDHRDLSVRGGKNCSTGASYDDGNGHGTHVAGTIGARDNSIGVVGVAPGVRLHAVRVLDNSGRGSWSSIICGVDWVTSNASVIDVVNMSLGGRGSEPTGTGCSTGDALHDAICSSVGAGVTYAVASGNAADDAARHVPAAYDEVMTVSALADFNGLPGGGATPTCRTDQDDTFASFSSFGPDVDLVAPGVCIRSTWKGGRYKTISGTSMATPHVAGAAALYDSGNPGAPPAEVKSALQGAGNLYWDAFDDGDALKETLLNVDAF